MHSCSLSGPGGKSTSHPPSPKVRKRSAERRSFSLTFHHTAPPDRSLLRASVFTMPTVDRPPTFPNARRTGPRLARYNTKSCRNPKRRHPPTIYNVVFHYGAHFVRSDFKWTAYPWVIFQRLPTRRCRLPTHTAHAFMVLYHP